jgi:hypothetical protein
MNFTCAGVSSAESALKATVGNAFCVQQLLDLEAGGPPDGERNQ